MCDNDHAVCARKPYCANKSLSGSHRTAPFPSRARATPLNYVVLSAPPLRTSLAICSRRSDATDDFVNLLHDLPLSAYAERALLRRRTQEYPVEEHSFIFIELDRRLTKSTKEDKKKDVAPSERKTSREWQPSTSFACSSPESASDVHTAPTTSSRARDGYWRT